MKTDKKLCGICLTSGKGSSWSCGVQGHPLMSVSHKIRFPAKDASKSQWIKILSVSPFDNPYHTSQPGYQSLLKTLGLKSSNRK